MVVTTMRSVAAATAAGVLLYGARRYFRNWGSTKEECRMPLPGDELLHRPVLQTTEAIWVDRSTAAVWPWLVQMGQDRGGLYGFAALEKSLGLQYRNADRIHPEWQRLEAGDVVRLAPRGWMGLRQGFALPVVEVVDQECVVLRVAPPDLPWETVLSFHLVPYWDDRCRLLVRTRVALRHPGEVVAAELASPLTTFITRGILRGIRRRVRDAGRLPQPAASLATSG